LNIEYVESPLVKNSADLKEWDREGDVLRSS